MRMVLRFSATGGTAAGKLIGTKASDRFLPVCFDSLIQRRNWLALRSLSKAIRETGISGHYLDGCGIRLKTGLLDAHR